MITGWDILRYLYFASCISMGMYIMARSDQFLMSYGLNKNEEKIDKESGLSFTTTMIVYILLSPILWLVILDQNNRKK